MILRLSNHIKAQPKLALIKTAFKTQQTDELNCLSHRSIDKLNRLFIMTAQFLLRRILINYLVAKNHRELK